MARNVWFASGAGPLRVARRAHMSTGRQRVDAHAKRTSSTSHDPAEAKSAVRLPAGTPTCGQRSGVWDVNRTRGRRTAGA